MKSFTCLALVFAAACTGDESTSSQSLTQPPGECGKIETHVFGIHSAPGNEVTVRIDRPGHHALALSAYDATTWHVVTGPGVTIDGIYAVGVHKQTIANLASMPADMKFVSDNRDDGGPYGCGYAWDGYEQDCNSEQLIKLVSKVVHDPNTFHGCFSASEFTMGTDMATTSNCVGNFDGGSTMSEWASCLGPDSCGKIF